MDKSMIAPPFFRVNILCKLIVNLLPHPHTFMESFIIMVTGETGLAWLILLLFIGGVSGAGPRPLQAAALLAGRSHRPGVLSVSGVLHQPLTAGTH